jgi:hypothetical protein
VVGYAFESCSTFSVVVLIIDKDCVLAFKGKGHPAGHQLTVNRTTALL